jgi:hypothetical protein
MAKRSVQLVVSVFTNAACVQDNNIGFVISFDAFQTIGFKKPRNTFGVVRIHLAPERVHYI